jgi:hypothetical protein
MSWLKCKVTWDEQGEFIQWCDQHTTGRDWQGRAVLNPRRDEPFICWILPNDNKARMFAKLRWG